MNKGTFTAISTALLLQACGTIPQDRTVSGAGLGAATGAVIGAVTTMAVLPAAAIGAAAGALTGALTTPEQVNLGTPAWKHGVQSTTPPAAPTASVTEIQSHLSNLGYDPGPVDGVCGPRTRAAIRQYQQDRGLIADGVPSVALAESLREADS